MAEKRVQFQDIVENQLPTYVQTEFPLVSDFLKSYYVSQEFQGAPVDLIQNIDDYTKVDNLTNLTENSKNQTSTPDKIQHNKACVFVDYCVWFWGAVMGKCSRSISRFISFS